jgi:hypothetical protein
LHAIARRRERENAQRYLRVQTALLGNANHARHEMAKEPKQQEPHDLVRVAEEAAATDPVAAGEVADDSWQELFKAATHESNEFKDGEFKKFERVGDRICGRVVGYQMPNEHIKNGLVKIETADGVITPVGLGGNLGSLLADRAVELMQRRAIISIWFVSQDAAKKKGHSGMKRYRVLDHGHVMPEWAAVSDE